MKRIWKRRNPFLAFTLYIVGRMHGSTYYIFIFPFSYLDAVGENHNTTCTSSDDIDFHDQAVDHVSQTDVERERITEERIACAEQLLILGRSYQEKDENEDAIKSYEQAVQIAVEIHHNDIKAKAYQQLGNVLTATSEYKKAIEYYQKAREISPDLGADAMEVLAYQWLGYHNLQAGQYQESIQHYNEAVKHASQLGDQNSKINSYLGLGSAFSYTGEFESARKYFLKVLAVAEQLADKASQKKAYTNLGYVYYKSRKFDAAVKSYLKVQEISHDLADRKEEANACLMLGDTFQKLKRHEKAIESYKEALNITEELADKEMQVVAIQRLGTLFLVCCKECDYEKAIEWYERALDILGSKPNDHLLHVKALTGLGGKEFEEKETQVVAIQRLGTIYLDLASVCCKDCDYEKAIEWYEKALDIFRKQPNNRFLYVKALTGLGATWFSLGNNEKATEAIQEAQKLATKESDTAGNYCKYNCAFAEKERLFFGETFDILLKKWKERLFFGEISILTKNVFQRLR